MSVGGEQRSPPNRNEADRRKAARSLAIGRGSLMDPYTALKMLEYNQQELAKARGQRNWVTIFRKR